MEREIIRVSPTAIAILLLVDFIHMYVSLHPYLAHTDINQPGYAAAVSENLYGVGPGQGAGPMCGTCWRLTLEEDADSGNRVKNAGNSIVVMVNNLCPRHDPRGYDNPLCEQADLNSTSVNSYGGVVDFNLCNDDGARGALFGDSGTGLGIGTATEVSCSEWSGTKKYDAGSDQSTSSSGSGSGTTTTSTSGVIGGGGTAAPAQSVGGAGKLSTWGLLGLIVPLVVMVRL